MYDDLVKRLRRCASDTVEDCDGCPYQGGYKGTYCMNGLIEEAADAIEELTGFIQEAERDRDEYRERLDKANNAIEDLENKLNLWRQGKVSRWIPVTERLPEIGENVLLYAYGRVHFGRLLFLENNLGHPTFLMEQSGLQHAPVLETTTKGRITHWMPLPKPPEEET